MTQEPAARVAWRVLEPGHAVVYFAPDVAEAVASTGVPGWWRGEFAGRGGCGWPPGWERMHPMSDAPVERGELIMPGGPIAPPPEPGEEIVEGEGDDKEFVSEPAKVMRVGSMIKQLLDEVRSTSLDEPSRQRLRAIYDTSIEELGSALSPDLRDELQRLAFPFADEGTPTEVELRVAQAQLVGWLEGLFHGIQATLFAQQMAARQQLENMRQQLGPGARPGPPPEDRPGTYL